MNLIRDTFLINDITRAIIREVHCHNFYERLSELAPNEKDKQVITRIQQEKAKHYHWFTMILRRIGGQQPKIPVGKLPLKFDEGLRTAISNELQAAALYQSIATRATHQDIQIHFMNASYDEQRHAYWLQDMSMSLLNINSKNVISIDNRSEEEYKQYVLSWIDEFVKVQNENPLVFSIETKYLDTNREAIQRRIRTLNIFQYPEDKVPEKYKEIHKELLQTLASYKEIYENLYLAITTGDSKAVGSNVGGLYQLDITLNKIKDDLSK